MKTKLWALVAILLCTVCTSLAASFNKKGATLLELSLKGTIFNYHLIIGLTLLVIGSVLLMVALKGGDVSVVYPIIATSYIWVIIISGVFFNEQINIMKILGILFIVIGVITINIAEKKKLFMKIGIRV
jgi:drug/metabolite transporter (DMT)-like permease